MGACRPPVYLQPKNDGRLFQLAAGISRLKVRIVNGASELLVDWEVARVVRLQLKLFVPLGADIGDVLCRSCSKTKER